MHASDILGMRLCGGSPTTLHVADALSPDDLDVFLESICTGEACAIVLIPRMAATAIAQQEVGNIDLHLRASRNAHARDDTNIEALKASGSKLMAALLELRTHLCHTDTSSPTVRRKRPMLTQRQTAILELIAKGKSNKEIASGMQLACETVKSHVRQIFRRLQVSNRVQAARAFRMLRQSTKT